MNHKEFDAQLNVLDENKSKLSISERTFLQLLLIFIQVSETEGFISLRNEYDVFLKGKGIKNDPIE